jgi:hypothetical protein
VSPPEFISVTDLIAAAPPFVVSGFVVAVVVLSLVVAWSPLSLHASETNNKIAKAKIADKFFINAPVYYVTAVLIGIIEIEDENGRVLPAAQKIISRRGKSLQSCSDRLII